VFGAEKILERPSSKIQKFWILAGNGYLVYINGSSDDVSVWLLMEHVSAHTESAQLKFGQVLEKSVQILQLGYDLKEDAIRTEIRHRISSPPKSPVSSRSPTKGMSPKSMSPKSPHLVSLEQQMKELTLAVCQYAQKTNTALEDIRKSVNKSE
jgi:hypothetical protein